MKHIFLFLLLTAVVLPSSAQTHYSEIDYPNLPAFDIPDATRIELPNGIVLFLIQDSALPMIRLSARIGTGSIFEPADKAGLASLVGTVMRTGGTESVSGDQLNERLESIAASIETGIGQTSGSASMFALTEHLDTVLPLFADVLMHPAFPEDKLELARTQLKSGISRRNDDSGQIASREFNEIMYGSDSPWARSAEYATADAITRDDLVSFHEAFFHPANLIVGAWGDFEVQEMADAIGAVFAEWSSGPFLRPELPSTDYAGGAGVHLVSKDDVTQSTIYLGHQGSITRAHEDYPAIMLMNQVLSGGFSGRLMKSVRVEQGLAYGVGGGYSANYDRPGAFFAQVMTKSESTVEATEAVLREVEKMREAPPTEEEVNLARDSYLNRFVFNFDTRSEIVGRMMTYEYYDYPTDFLERQKDALEAVTPDDIHAAAREYLRPEEAKIMVVGKPDEFGEPLTALGEVTEVDITIPTGDEPLPEASDETSQSGRALLTAARASMGGESAFAAVTGFIQEGSQRIVTPDGQTFDLGLKVTVQLPNQARFEQQTPGGAMVITKDGDEIGLPAMIPEQMAGQMKQQVNTGLWQNPLFFLANADAVEAQQLADGELDGRAARVVLVSPPDGVEPFRLYLDVETDRPIGISYQRGPSLVHEVFGDYRDSGAFTVPYSVVVFEGERESGRVTYELIDMNPALEDGLFQQ